MTAAIVHLSDHRAHKHRSRFTTVGTQDYTLGAWLSSEHQAVMGPYSPTLPCERVPLIELPSDVE